jgi:hypothetical protein
MPANPSDQKKEKLKNDKTDLPSFGLKKLLAWFAEHPAMAVTCFLIFASFIGAVYELPLYDRFDINFLDYAKPEDFFFNWTRDLSTLIFVLSYILIPLITLLGYYIYTHTSYPHFLSSRITRSILLFFIVTINGLILWKYNSFFFPSIAVTYFFLIYLLPDMIKANFKKFLAVLFLSCYATIPLVSYAKSVTAYLNIINEDLVYTIHVKNQFDENDSISNVSIIGSSSDYKFFYSHNTGSAVIIPVDNIALIQKYSQPDNTGDDALPQQEPTTTVKDN